MGERPDAGRALRRFAKNAREEKSGRLEGRPLVVQLQSTRTSQ
jgi:hypothetical protein